MANMSYCRFRNTVEDFEDCVENWEENDLSEEEERARKRLLRLAEDLVANYGGAK